MFPRFNLIEKAIAGTFGFAHLSMTEQRVVGLDVALVDAKLDDTIDCVDHLFGGQFGCIEYDIIGVCIVGRIIFF